MRDIIANIIARNESERFLEPVLDRLASQVDIICFTDDNSSDNTVEIAERYGCKINKIELDNPNDSLFSQNEGLLRQQSWEFLDKFGRRGDWVLAIDCDEMLYETHPNSLKKIVNQSRYKVANIEFYHMWNETQYRVDKAWAPSNSSRFFAYMPRGSFINRKMACGSEPTYVRKFISSGKFLVNSGLKMKHLGYTYDEDKLSKHDRYSKLDGGEFHALKHIESIVDENPTLEDWLLD